MHRSVHWIAPALGVALLTAAATTSAGAAPTDRPDKVGSTRSVSPDGAVAKDALRAAKAEADRTLLGTRQKAVVHAALQDSSGATHVRMHRTYAGLPVVGGDFVVHRDASGDLTKVTKTLTKQLTLSTSPKLDKASVLDKLGLTAKKTSGTPQLVVDALEATPRLAWIVTTTGRQKDGTPSRLERYVDAAKGTTIRTVERIQTVDGEGQSLYGGTVPLNLTQADGGYQLKDAGRGNTYTIDVGNKTDGLLCQLLGVGCATGSVVTSPDTSFGDGTAGNRESAAVDAQYGTDATWDYFKKTFGRDGIFGNGKGSYNRVHYGNGYVNAFWDGEKMTYGDGDGSDFGPLTSLDVAGHEMSHGVTENTAGLTYSGESGGLNEATSDIFGTMVEFSANNAKDPGDYLIGEQFDLKNHRGLRRMDDPASDGKSLACWDANAKNVDVHYSSGIGNHFFYLLAEGSGSKTIGGVAHSSKTCDGSTVAGIGRTDAAAIWYRALTVYMTSNTDYAGAREATLSAAKDLYGESSAQHAAVAKAWSAVKVG